MKFTKTEFRAYLAKTFLLVSQLSLLTACHGFRSDVLELNTASVGRGKVDFASAFTGSNACDALAPAMAAERDVTSILQDCLDRAPLKSIVDLPAGVARVSKTIEIKKAVMLKTAGKPAGQVCDSVEKHDCFELRAIANLESGGGQGFLNITGDGAAVVSIVVNGNRAERLNSRAAMACRNGDNGQAYNMNVIANGVTVRGIVSKNALCGTAMAVRGDQLDVVGNAIVANGDHRDLFADGMTVGEATNSTFNGNLFVNNTDVDFIFGGCRGCLIQGNIVRHGPDFSTSSFAAMMLHAWGGPQGTSGDYTGSDISSNQIDCGERRRCGVGLYLGSELWYTAPLFGGYYHDNQINNALNGFLIEKATGLIRIKDNVVTNSGGAIWTERLRIERAYPANIAFADNVRIEDTIVPRSAYVNIPLGKAVPNFWNRDVAWDQGGIVELLPKSESASRLMTSALFDSILGREPDPATVDSLKNKSCTFIGNLVANSPEANGIYSRQANGAFIEYIYKGLMDRAGDAGGVEAWTAELNANRMSRSQVITAFIQEAEFTNRCRTMGFTLIQ